MNEEMAVNELPLAGCVNDELISLYLCIVYVNGMLQSFVSVNSFDIFFSQQSNLRHDVYINGER